MPYFDWNATAPLLPEAREAWLEASGRYWANPSTPYREGVRARLALDEARERVAVCLGVDPEQVVFTSGATEGNNGLLREAMRRLSPAAEVWISAVEHPCVRESAFSWWGPERVRVMPVKASGELDGEWLEACLEKSRPGLLCLMAVNNETGVIQPVERAVDLCRERGVPVFCDAVQWVGKQLAPADLASRCDALVASGHKFGGPKGIGFVVLGSEWRGVRLQTGGAQELASRAGTENLAGILAMVAALEARCQLSLPGDQKAARDHFESELTALWPDEVIIYGKEAARSWNTCMVSLPEYRADRWINRLDKLGFQVSSGSACSSGKEGISGVLQAMQADIDQARRAIRISSGWETRPADWDGLLEALKRVREQLDSEESGSGPGQVIEI